MEIVPITRHHQFIALLGQEMHLCLEILGFFKKHLFYPDFKVFRSICNSTAIFFMITCNVNKPGHINEPFISLSRSFLCMFNVSHQNNDFIDVIFIALQMLHRHIHQPQDQRKLFYCSLQNMSFSKPSPHFNIFNRCNRAIHCLTWPSTGSSCCRVARTNTAVFPIPDLA